MDGQVYMTVDMFTDRSDKGRYEYMPYTCMFTHKSNTCMFIDRSDIFMRKCNMFRQVRYIYKQK